MFDRFEIIDQLEERYAPNPKGEYFLCKDGKHRLDNRVVELSGHSTGYLEVMLHKSMSVAEYDDLRRMILHEEQIMNAETAEADEWFKKLTPKAQKQVIKRAYQQWYEDQQVAYQMAEGSY